MGVYPSRSLHKARTFITFSLEVELFWAAPVVLIVITLFKAAINVSVEALVRLRLQAVEVKGQALHLFKNKKKPVMHWEQVLADEQVWQF